MNRDSNCYCTTKSSIDASLARIHFKELLFRLYLEAKSVLLISAKWKLFRTLLKCPRTLMHGLVEVFSQNIRVVYNLGALGHLQGIPKCIQGIPRFT